MDSQYQHPSIQLYIMGLKSAAGNTENPQEDNIDQKIDRVCSSRENDKKDVSCDETDIQKAEEPVTENADEKVSDWEVRRIGSMAARLLQDVKIA